jgi:hypothetical protein
LQAFHERQGNVAEEIPFMELVEEDGGDIGERSVILEPTEQNAFGYITDAGSQAGLVVEPDLVADFGAEGAMAFPGHARGDGSSRDTTWLEDNDFLVSGQAGIKEHLGHLSGFAGTGGRNQDESIARTQRLNNLRMNLPDGKFGHCSEIHVSQCQSNQCDDQHHASRQELFGLRQTHGEYHEQCGQKYVGNVGLEHDMSGAQNERGGEASRHHKGDLAFAFEEAD